MHNIKKAKKEILDLLLHLYIKSLLALGCLILTFYSCQSPQASKQELEMEKLKYSEKVIQVNASIIKSTVFNKEIVSNGIIAPHKKAKLVINVNENISEVNVKNGQVVKQGEVLAILDDYSLKLNFDRAKNQLLKSEIELKDILLAHYPNLSDIADIANVSPQVLETARGRSGYNDALIQVKEAECRLSQTVIKAPFDGIISDIQVKENNYSGNYDFFAYVLDISKMEIEFGIMESELEMISLNANIMVTPYAFHGKKISGKINEINPAVGESGMIKVKAILPNPNGVLMDGMNAEVVVQKEMLNQLVVPKEAVLLRQGREILFTLKNDSIAQWVYVKTGFENANQYSITEGITEGDTIITSNNFNLGHEVIVRARIIN